MPKYEVSFIKIESYEVEANNTYEAEDLGLEMLHDNEYAFLDGPVHEIEIKEIR